MANENQQMTAVSLFAGVGGFDLALERNGVNVVAAVEIDKHAQAVLAKQFPNTQLFNDVTEVTGEQLISAGFDPRNGILVGGFPCQDLSVAGRRAGLAGKRSGLFYEVVRIIEEVQPEWFVLENVPGLLSSQRGADMGAVVGTLVECGYGISWRVLDAQYFGVPQRRRRVFIVGRRFGDWRSAAKVLFERESVRGDSQASRASGQEVAGTSAESTTESGSGLRGTERVVITQNQRGDIRIGEVSTALLANSGMNNTPYAFEPVEEGVANGLEQTPTPFTNPLSGATPRI
jgi:DNA (cytosine-5)-methyltransferase 1